MIALLKFWPIGLALIVGAGSWFGGYRMAVKDHKIEIPAYPKCPDCKCPPAVNTVDFEKIKGFKGSIVLHQHYSIEANGDSLILARVQEALRKELEDFKIRKCK